MRLFQNIKKFLKRSAVTLFTRTLTGFGLAQVTVTREKTLGISAVWRALEIYSSTIAGLPLEVFERQTNGDNDRAVDHPLFYLLHDEPHRLYTAFDFRRALILNLVNPANGGNSYALIERGIDAEPLGIRILVPGECEPVYNDQTFELYYRIRGHYYDPSDIIHIKGLSENGLAGYAKATIHKDALGNVIATQEHAKNYYANGAHISGVLERPIEAPVMSGKAVDNLSGQFTNRYGGVENTGKVPVLQEGTTFRPMSSNAKDAGLNESRSFNIEEVARIVGVPVHLLSSLERATFNNIEHLTLQFVKFGISALCKQIEQEFNRKLLRKDEKGRYFVRFNLDDLLRGDVETRTKYYESALKYGWLNRNEIRRMENFNRIEDGDTYLVPMNMSPLEQIEEIIASSKSDNQKLANAA